MMLCEKDFFADVYSMSDESAEEKLTDMVPVPISELITGTNVPVNLYIRLGESKYLLVAKAGTKADKSRFSNYKNKALEYLWVRKDQYGALVKSSLIIAGMIVEQKSFDLNTKSNILSTASKSVFRKFGEEGITLESYAMANEIVDATINLAENHRDLKGLFDSYASCSDDLLKHSLAVCAVSVLIAQTLGWDSRGTIEKLALGALLHDLGKKTLPPDLLKKPKVLMSHDELQLYETHAYKGMQMLVALGVVPDDVISIVYEHHENSIGQGYPRRLWNVKMHPLAKVVALANEFCNLTVPSEAAPNAKSPREALLIIELTMGQPFAKDCFKALQKLVLEDANKLAG